MAGKEKEVKATTEERFVISPTFDKEVYEKIQALAAADERSMAQWLTRYVRDGLKAIKVPEHGNGLAVMSTTAK